MPYVNTLVPPAISISVISTEGKYFYSKHETIERFCKKCRKKWYADNRKTFFYMLDNHKIRMAPQSKLHYCGECLWDFTADNQSLDMWL